MKRQFFNFKYICGCFTLVAIIMLIFLFNYKKISKHKDNIINKTFSVIDTQSFNSKFNGTIILSNQHGGNYALEMIKVKAGEFWMKDSNPDTNVLNNEQQRRVKITHDYWLGKYEVTIEQYKTVMGKLPSTISHFQINSIKNKPIVSITWNEAVEFCKKMNLMYAAALPSGYKFSLPTEAQWEYAARGGNKSMNYNFCGSNSIDDVAWHSHNSGRETHQVGLKSPNELGFYDMSGNVSEWCLDCSSEPVGRSNSFDGAVSSNNRDKSATSGNSSSHLIEDPYCAIGDYALFRGGGFSDDSQDCTLTVRKSLISSYRYDFIGFRLALVPKKDKDALTPDDKTWNSTQTKERLPQTDLQSACNRIVSLPGDIPLEMVKIEAGEFIMGNTDDDLKNARNVNKHNVKLTSDFWLGKYEVTQEQFEAVTGRCPSNDKRGGKFPVESVSWEDAREFCFRLTKFEHKAGRLPDGYVYDLPTEAQWEYAARGGNKTKKYKYSGSDEKSEVAWYAHNSGDPYLDEQGILMRKKNAIHPVGQKKANELGLHDMCGNVEEWCLDLGMPLDLGGVKTDTYHDDIEDPINTLGTWPLQRGGSFHSTECRVWMRSCTSPDCHPLIQGFRIALVPKIKLANISSKQTTEFGNDVTNRKPENVNDSKTINSGDNIKVSLPDSESLELIYVPAGSFMMGNEDSDDTFGDETFHNVTLTSDFWLGKYEVTIGQYASVMKNNPIHYESIKDKRNYPVRLVNWHDAREFCMNLTRLERNAGRLPQGYVYELPTEAQWEYAAKGMKKTQSFLYSGSNSPDLVGWYYDNSQESKGISTIMHPAGEKNANELGFHDMVGNAKEWCLDKCKWNGVFVTDTYYDGAINPCCLNGEMRIFRGGSINSSAWYVRSVCRNGTLPSQTSDDIGFRVSLVKEEDIVRIQRNFDKEKIDESHSKSNVPKVLEQGKFDKLVILPGNVSLELLKVDAGSFIMGRENENESAFREKKSSLVKITLNQAFWLGKYEITQEQYVAVMGENPSYFKNGGKFPVESLNWEDARQFCSKLTKLEQDAGRLPEGYVFDLPTEAQWEFAAKGGLRSQKSEFSGSNSINDVAWYFANTNESHIVGQKSANELGFYDMSGNVKEWCLDMCDIDGRGYIISEKLKKEIEDPCSYSGKKRVVRGGGWKSASYACRSTYRQCNDPAILKIDIGFRVALIPKTQINPQPSQN